MKFRDANDQYEALLEQYRTIRDDVLAAPIGEQLEALRIQESRQYVLPDGLRVYLGFTVVKWGKGLYFDTSAAFTAANLRQAAEIAETFEKWIAGELDELPPSGSWPVIN